MTIQDVIQILGALAAVLAALASVLNRLGQIRGANKLEEVHRAVNSTADAQNDRVDQLTQALTSSGTTVPPRASPPPPPDTDWTG